MTRRAEDDPEQTIRLPGSAKALRAIETAPRIDGPKRADRAKVRAAVRKIIPNRIT